ncbi:hypothetical protein CEXT_30951 [Caerostris extrusa]|uniref:Uncharacterized protein n=1 Tax=Caerostris extrusa TaxID=172846 RepID=A0AAV4WMV8_CAEEX|nr:hypothetical protein CEXT_30951 [Caerostris extrusa]
MLEGDKRAKLAAVFESQYKFRQTIRRLETRVADCDRNRMHQFAELAQSSEASALCGQAPALAKAGKCHSVDQLTSEKKWILIKPMEKSSDEV